MEERRKCFCSRTAQLARPVLDVPASSRRRLAVDTPGGHRSGMGLIILLIVLALIFGVGSLLEGLAWGFLIVVGLIAGAGVLGYRKLRSAAAR